MSLLHELFWPNRRPGRGFGHDVNCGSLKTYFLIGVPCIGIADFIGDSGRRGLLFNIMLKGSLHSQTTPAGLPIIRHYERYRAIEDGSGERFDHLG